MLRRPILLAFTFLPGAAMIGAALQAQLESGERGIMPIDSSGTLEIGGIHVDFSAKDSVSARYAGWRIAQRGGFKSLVAATHKLPVSRAPTLPDSILDGLGSSSSREPSGTSKRIASWMGAT